jgi:RNA polymerase sigma factor (sigma-70 family)
VLTNISDLSQNALSDGNQENHTDNYFVEKCLQGHTQSYRKLYQRHQQRVRAILYQLCYPESLDDLVQEVFLKAWKGLPKFRADCQFSTWLYRITYNVAADYRYETAKKLKQLENLTEKSPSQQEAPDLMHLHYQDLVQRGLGQLSFDHRTILVLHDLEEITQKEIASILNIPLGTVKSRLFHSRAAMKKYLQQQGVDI